MNTPLKNLTRKSTEEATLRILRQNKTATPSHVPSNLGDKIAKKYIRGEFTKRNKLPFEAEPLNRTAVTRAGPYRTGDGDLPIAMRPGCDDHKKFKSLMTEGTIVYPRGHK